MSCSAVYSIHAFWKGNGKKGLIMQNMQNVQKMQNMQNMQNAHNMQNMQSMQNMQNIQKCKIFKICKNCQLSQLSKMIFCWVIYLWTWHMDSRILIAQFCFAYTKLIPQAMQSMLNKFQKMFGINFWRNTILEVTLCVCWIQWKSNYLSEFPQIKLSTGNTLEPRPWV